MSLAETALQERAESAESQAEVNKLPIPGEYTVESTGTPQVPMGSTIVITVEDFKGWFTLDGETLGNTQPLANGDFLVRYPFGASEGLLQFRQTGTSAEYIFGVAVSFPNPARAKAMDDPPITGVWGAETPPPAPYAEV